MAAKRNFSTDFVSGSKNNEDVFSFIVIVFFRIKHNFLWPFKSRLLEDAQQHYPKIFLNVNTNLYNETISFFFFLYLSIQILLYNKI